MGDEKLRYDALRRVYEERLDHLTTSVRKVYLTLRSDEVGLALKESPGMGGLYRAHLEEIGELVSLLSPGALRKEPVILG